MAFYSAAVRNTGPHRVRDTTVVLNPSSRGLLRAEGQIYRLFEFVFESNRVS